MVTDDFLGWIYSSPVRIINDKSKRGRITAPSGGRRHIWWIGPDDKENCHLNLSQVMCALALCQVAAAGAKCLPSRISMLLHACLCLANAPASTYSQFYSYRSGAQRLVSFSLHVIEYRMHAVEYFTMYLICYVLVIVSVSQKTTVQ